jgi:hypothetical protein
MEPVEIEPCYHPICLSGLPAIAELADVVSVDLD